MFLVAPVPSAVASPALQVTITSGPSGTTDQTSATFTFEANERGATFRCSLDGSTPATCNSPIGYSGLADGDHLFTVQALDASGANPDSDSRRWTVQTVAPPPDEPRPSPLLPVGGARAKLKPRGGFTLGANRFRKLTLGKPPRLYAQDEEHEEGLEKVQPACSAVGSCLVTLGGEANPFETTPAPTDDPFEVAGGGDPQIAAGKSYLIVTSYSKFWIYTKDGKLVTKDKYGSPLSFPMTAAELFKPLWDPPGRKAKSINSYLKLPSGVPCDVDDPFATGTFCLNDWYDMRVIYDDYRNRFWMIAVARNPNWKNEDATLKQRISRRTKVALAVSKTADPRDGFYLYWWNGVIDDGACATLGSPPGPPAACPNSTYQPGDASDYPSLGISKDFFTQTIGVVNVNPHDPDWPVSVGKYALVNVFDADKLANGGCSSPCGWSYWNFPYPGTDTVVNGIVQPAVEHGAVQNDFATMANTQGDKTLWVWGFTKQEGAFAPPLHGAAIKVKKWAGPTNPDQPPKGSVTDPSPISYDNLGNLVTKAVTRGGLMYATWQDCAVWFDGQAPCSSSIRLVKVDPGLALTVDAPTGPIIDRTFGFHTLGEGDQEAIGYGVPAVEANKHSDAVVVYQRVGGTDTWPEARYSAYMNGEPDIRPSAVLMAGARPYGGNADPDDPDKAIGNADTGGASVDPIGKEAIWMAHAFASSSGSYRIAVGKVFGKPFADLITIVSKFDLDLGGNARKANATVLVGNQGDGKAPRSVLHIFLVPKKGKPKPLGTVHVPRLPSGRFKKLHLDLGLPRVLGPGPFRLKAVVDPSKRIKQYGEKNDSALSRRVYH
jgi:hypothetical protein